MNLTLRARLSPVPYPVHVAAGFDGDSFAWHCSVLFTLQYHLPPAFVLSYSQPGSNARSMLADMSSAVIRCLPATHDECCEPGERLKKRNQLVNLRSASQNRHRRSKNPQRPTEKAQNLALSYALYEVLFGSRRTESLSMVLIGLRCGTLRTDISSSVQHGSHNLSSGPLTSVAEAFCAY